MWPGPLVSKGDGGEDHPGQEEDRRLFPLPAPTGEELSARIDAVLTVVHLLLTTGHTAPTGADRVRMELVERSLDLARMLQACCPTTADSYRARSPPDRCRRRRNVTPSTSTPLRAPRS